MKMEIKQVIMCVSILFGGVVANAQYVPYANHLMTDVSQRCIALDMLKSIQRYATMRLRLII